MNTSKYFLLIFYFFYIVFFISLICSFRAITSISIALILLTGLLKNKIDTGSFFNSNIKNNFLIACSIFYVMQVILLLFSSNHTEIVKHIQLKSSLIFVPLAICCGSYLNENVYRKLMSWYCCIMAFAILLCLGIAFYQYYFLNAATGVFFYHALVKPFNQHAVQVSILLFTGIIFLLESAKKELYLYNRPIHYLLLFYFTGCILLLSSKLVIAFLAISFGVYFFLALKNRKNFRLITIISLTAGIAIIISVMVTRNRISKRYAEILNTDLSLISRKNFDPGIYFDGLQFRLLQFRFVKEILNEKKAWFTGVSDDAQSLIDQKYISTHMYTGDGKAPGHGYIDYNTHNQFLESLLHSGIPGLLFFIFICYAMIGLAVKIKSRELSFIVALLLAYSLNESVLEKQYSITIFTFFPLFFYYSMKTGK